MLRAGDYRQRMCGGLRPPLRSTQERLYSEVWKRPGLSPRDRSIITIAALIARELTLPMPYYFNQALDNGVTPREISEIITHLAFYSGWANAFAAVGAARGAKAIRQAGAFADRIVLELNRLFRPSADVPSGRLFVCPPQRSCGQHWSVSAGHVKKPNLLCVRSVEHLDRLRRRLQQNLAALFREIGFSFRR